VRLLLDTHVWLWLLTAPGRISDDVLESLSDLGNDLLLSAASAWEIAIKYALGKLPLPEPPASYVPGRMQRSGVTPLPVLHEHALAVAELPAHHRDPFDRLLVAQARLERLTLVTADSVFARYGIDVRWAPGEPS
jgi:PIN domain nuclease of toxin-antitoxin system